MNSVESIGNKKNWNLSFENFGEYPEKLDKFHKETKI